MAAVLWGIARRLQLPALEARHSQIGVLGLFALVNGVISIGLMAMAALLTGAPFIFPSLGPTAFLLFYTPTLPAASPRNTLGGHLIGALAGYLALVVFGLTERGPALASGVEWANVGAAALSLGLTSGAMVWLQGSAPAGRRDHPHRLARHPAPALAARRADARRRPPARPGLRDQPPGGHRLSGLGAAAGSGTRRAARARPRSDERHLRLVRPLRERAAMRSTPISRILCATMASTFTSAYVGTFLSSRCRHRDRPIAGATSDIPSVGSQPTEHPARVVAGAGTGPCLA